MKMIRMIMTAVLTIVFGITVVFAQEAEPLDSVGISMPSETTAASVASHDEIVKLEKEISVLNQKIEMLENEEEPFPWFLVIVVVAGTFCACLAVYICNKNSERIKGLNSEMKTLRKMVNENYANAAREHVSNSSDMAYRLGMIEKQIAQLSKYRVNQGAMSSVAPEKKGEPRNVSRRGYFSTPIKGGGGKGYFKRLMESGDDARFTAIVSGKEATFEPNVNVRAIISSDAMDLAVRFEGRSKNENPTTMRVRQKGRAVLVDDKWMIVAQAVVVLD